MLDEAVKVAFKSLTDRAIEWFSAGVMVAWGVTLSLPGDTLSQPGFVAFRRFGFSEEFWIFFLTFFGVLRLAALYINGRWPKSPYIRMVCAACGAFVWGQVAYRIYEAAAINNTPVSTGSAVYGLLAAFELFSIYRAAFDARYDHP